MKIRKAIRHVMEGGMVRRPKWFPGLFMCGDGVNPVFRVGLLKMDKANDVVLELKDIMADDWEVVE